MSARSSIVIYFFGEMISKGLPFFFIPYLTRKLGPAGYGELAYALTIVAFASIFISLGQEAATFSYYYKKGKRALPYLRTSSMILMFALTILVAISLFLLKIKYWFLLASISSVAILINYHMATLQAQKKEFEYILIQISSAILLIIFTFSFLELMDGDKVKLRLDAMLWSSFVVLIPIIFFFIKNTYNFLNLKKIKLYSLYLLSYGIPIFFHSFSLLIKGQIDRIFIYKQYDALSLGVFSAGVQIAGLLSILLGVVNKALVPTYYENLKNKNLNESKIIKLALYSLPLTLIPSGLAFFIPESAYIWFLGQEYSGSKYYTYMYVFGMSLNIPYLILVNYFFYFGLTKVIAYITISMTIIYVIILYFMSKISIEFIPYALIFSNLLMVSVFMIVINSRRF
ncbi:oligosaccharide flippase family protein [Acinetobacter sp. WY4]|uniref:oligosaccharide flippase family protein n=1 Tax=Acinetobacter sp. WY4 TaxID=2708348 RepID=UPI001BD0FAB2|nr:oligosaccharide flippase family protein [Acinetobacter sp. WY4]